MKRIHNTGLWIGIITLLILSLQTVSALSVLPGGLLFSYEPGKVNSFNLNIQSDSPVEVTTLGDLNITLSSNRPAYSAGKSQVSATFTVPELTPGEHSWKIIVTETGEGGEGTITAHPAVSSTIKIISPHPGLYATADMYGDYAEDSIIITVPVTNRGVQDIKEAYASITIDEKTSDSSTTSIAAGETSKLKARIENVSKGVKDVVAVIQYDGEEIRLEKELTIGSPRFIIRSVNFPNFELGGINQVLIDVAHDWNRPIELSADIEIEGQNLTTTTEDISGSGLLEAYWDTTGIAAGSYEMIIHLHHDGATTTIATPIHVGFETEESEQQNNTGLWILMIAIILFIATIAFIMRNRTTE